MKPNLKNPLRVAIAVTAFALGGITAQAQVLNDWISNDLMIGFRASGGTGSSDSYLVNIGTAVNYNTNKTSFTLSLGGIGTDLAAKYGGDWYSRSDLFWGMFGTTISAAPTLYSSVARTDSNVQSTPPPDVLNGSTRNSTKTEITSVTTAFNLLSPTVNSTNAAFQPNAADASSYNYQVTQSGTDFGSVSQWNDIQGNLNQILDLYGQNNSGTFWRGSFSLNNSGIIAFSSNNPSPSPTPTPTPTTPSYVWTNTSGSWNQSANWSNSVPSNGVAVFFAGSGGNSTNDIGALSLASLTFSNTAGSYTISGSNLIVGGIVNNSTNNQTISLGLGFTNNSTANAASGSLDLTGGVTLSNGSMLTITGASNAMIGGTLSGNGSLTKTDTGRATLSGSNSYVGGTTVSAGALVASNATALGNSNNSLTVAGGLLDLAGTTNTQGTVTVVGGAVTNGGLTATNYQVQSGSISANLGGTASLTKSGSGTVTLSGSNSFNGSVTVNTGKLGIASGNSVSSSNAVIVAGGDLSVDTNNTAASFTITSGLLSGSGTLTAASYALNGGTVSGHLGAGSLTVVGSSTLSGTAASTNVSINSGSLTLAINNSLAANASVVISNTATLNLGSNTQTLAALSGNGGVSNNGSLTLNAPSPDISFGGSFTGNGTLTKSGTGTVTWSGDSSAYAGSTLLINGGIALNGRLGGTLTVTNSGSLSGSGTLSSVTVAGGGSINPGNSPGTMMVANTLSLNTGGILNWEISNWTGGAGSGWDLINAQNLQLENGNNPSQFTINVSGLGSVANFSNVSTNFVILSANNPLPSFNTNYFTVNSSGFTNAGATGSWSVFSSNNSLLLSYTVPLPQSNFVWATNSGSWGTASNWTNNAVPSDIVNLTFTGSGGSSTNNLSGITTTGITFATNAGSYTLSGSNLVLSGTILNNSSNSQTVSNNMSLGSASSLNAVSNNLTIGGNIDLSNNTLTITGASNAIIGGALSGNGTLIKSGSGTATLSGSNSYIGGTTLIAGTLVASHSSALGNSNNSLAVNGGTLNLDGTTNTQGTVTVAGGTVTNGGLTATNYQVQSGSISANLGGNASLTKSGTGTVTLSGSNSYVGGTTVSDGTLVASNASALGNSNNSLTVTNSGSLNLAGTTNTQGTVTVAGGTITNGGLNATNYQVQSGSISANLGGTASLTKSGSGTATLYGSNAYTGGTTLNAGTFVASNASALGNSANNLTVNGGMLDLGGTTNSQGAVTVTNGTVANGGLSATNFQVLAGSISANLGGSGSLTKSGTGTATLSGSNSFSGSVDVNAGKLGLASGNAISSGNAVTVAGGDLSVDTNNTAASFTITSGLLSGSGTMTAASYALNGGTVSGHLGAGSLSVGGSSTLSGKAAATNVSINSGSLTLATNNRLATNASVAISNAATLNLASNSQTIAALSGNGGVSNNGSLAIDGAASSTFAGSITGSGSLTKSGSGTLTLSGSNSYSGGTIVNSGELALNSSNALSRSNAISIAGGTLKTLTNFQTTGVVSLTNGSITGPGSLSASSFSLTSGMASAVLAGSGSLTKSGSGTVALSGSNSYTGGTTLNAGTLVASNALALGNSTNSLAVNGGNLDLGGSTNAQGTVTVAGGTVTNGGLNATNFQVQGGDISANLGGNASLTKSGTGTATLSGSNAYTGGTTVANGALYLIGSSALGNSTNALSVAGGLLDLGATSRTVGAFTLSGGSVTNGTLAASSYLLQSGVLHSSLSGSGNLTKSGTGTVSLYAASSGYTGGVSIANGTLRTFATNALGAGSVALSGSSSSAQGVLALQTNLTIGSLNWGSNGVIALTPGAMTLNIIGLFENAGGGVFDFGSYSATQTNIIATFASSTNFTTNSFSVISGGQWGFDLTSNSLAAFYLGGGSITNNSNAEITNSTTNSTTTVEGGTTEITAGVTLTSTNSVNVAGGNIVNYGNIVTPLVNVTSGGLGVASGASVTASNSVTISGDESVIVNNGVITTPELAVNNGGTLMGSGRIIGDVTVSGGNVSPGNSPGTLTVTGNYSVSSGALAIEVASPSNYDRVVVLGAASLGGTLNLIPYDGYVMQFGDNYTFLTASGGISGSFSATNTPSGIRARLLQTQTTLSALIAPTSYTQVAVTQNQINVARALDSFIPATSGDKLSVSTALDSLTASQYSTAFEAIQPTLYQSLSTLAFNNANAQNMGLVQRLWNQRIAGSGFSMSGFADNTPFLEGQGDSKSVMDPNKDILRAGPDNKWGLFVDGNGIFAQANSGNMLPNYNAQGGGVTTGVTYRVNPVISVGTYVGYQGTYAKYNGGSSMTDNSVRFGGFATYGRQDGKGFFADAILGGGYNSYQVTRNIQFGSVNRTANSAPTAGELDSMLATGYDFKKGNWTFGPTASLQYTYFGANSFSENGAQSLNLSNSGWNTSSMLSSLGTHVAYTWQATRDLVVVPQVNLSWQHEFLQSPYSINSSIGGANFANLSSTPIRDFLYTGVGVTLEIQQKWTTSIFYNAAAGNADLQSQNIFLSFGAKF